MPHSLRRSRLLALAAAAAIGVTGVSSCAGHGTSPQSQPKPHSRPKVHLTVPPGRQPVGGPSGHGLGLGRPVRGHPFHSPVRRPNLLMITVDDARHLDMQYMPHLKQLLAHQGVTLTNGMSPTPICVPARASLLTGQYAQNHGALTISGIGGGVGSFNDADTLPVWLKKAGYHTMFIGKYLNGYGQQDDPHYVPPGWDDWHATVDPSTYFFTHEKVNHNGHLSHHRTYTTTLLSRYCRQELGSPRRQKKPWYMWVNYVAPHVGGPDHTVPSTLDPHDRRPVKTTTPSRRDMGTFQWLKLPHTPDMFENPADKVIIRRTHQKWPPLRRAELRQANQQRVEALQAVDRALARTVRTLRRTHQLHRTYIVLTSDNGYVLGEHNITGKLYYFRNIVGVPMYIRGPGLPHGYTSRTPVTNADWAPTFAALAGAHPTRSEDGVDVLPWLTRHVSARMVPIEGWHVHGGTKPIYRGVVAGPWTYVQGQHHEAEMYDRTVDPWQNHNVIRDPRFQHQRHLLARMTRKDTRCAGHGCPHKFYR